jgi:hypothetical protein
MRFSSALVLALTMVALSSVSVAPQSSATRFVVSGDSRGNGSGVNETILAELVQATLDEGADFILVPGDLVYGSSVPSTLYSELTQWRSIAQPLYDAGVGVYPVRGNHDAAYKYIWDSVFSGVYALPNNGPTGEENVTYSFSHENVFVVGLDQYTLLNQVNQAWLDQQFTANELEHVFVFGHAPAFKVSHADCLDDHADARDTFWNSLTAEGARVYFCGHDHFYDHCRLDDGDGDPVNDVHQFIVGTAGAPLRSDGNYDGLNGQWTPIRVHHEQEFGYTLVEIDGPNVTITWKHRVSAGVYESTADTWNYSADRTSCCVGIRGNVDADADELIDIADLTALIGYLYLPGNPVPYCRPEANIDGDAERLVDVGDLTALIGYLYVPPYMEPAVCP